jgi:hypothetical protein
MHSERKRRFLATLVGLAAVLSIAAPVMAATDDDVIYDSIPEPVPGNLNSQPFQAQQVDQVGDHVAFAGESRDLESVTVVMSSWACETGHHTSGCTTSPGKTFDHEITLNLYAVDQTNAPAVGALLVSFTETFDIPFRPSSDPRCVGPNVHKWMAPDGTCYNGYAFEIEFDLEGVSVPDEIIFGVEYDTSGSGNSPTGEAGFYDSLNVGVVTSPLPTTGTNMETNVLFVDRAPGDVFQGELTAAGYTVAARFEIEDETTPPTTTPPTTTPPTTPPTTEPAPPVEPTTPPVTPDSDQVGLMDPASGMWNLRDESGSVNSFYFGNPGDYPFVGDWDCDGVDTPGLYRRSDGFVYLRNSNTQGVADVSFFFGNPGDLPLAGDFDADGCDTVSIHRPSEARIYVINELGKDGAGLGAADLSYVFGNPGDKPFVGDFNGDGIDTVGLHREPTGLVYFRQSHTQGIADQEFFFGNPDDRLVSGDWGVVDGTDTPGVFRPSNATFYFRYTNTQGNADGRLVWGDSNHLPVAGNWSK